MSLRLDNSRLGKKVINHFSAGFCLHIQSPKVVINSLVYRNFTSLFIFPECRAFRKRWQKKNTPSSDAFFLLACRRDSTGTDFQHPQHSSILHNVERNVITHLNVWRSQEMHQLGSVPRIFVTGGGLYGVDSVTTTIDGITRRGTWWRHHLWTYAIK